MYLEGTKKPSPLILSIFLLIVTVDASLSWSSKIKGLVQLGPLSFQGKKLKSNFGNLSALETMKKKIV